MAQVSPSTNPFALMMDPEAVFQALQSSERLGRLKSRICRPLDKPMHGQKADDDVARFDDQVEGEPVLEADSMAVEEPVEGLRS